MSGKFRDLSGEVFGRLTVTHEAGRNNRQAVLWYCACSCGGNTVALSNNLNRGHTKSCGCLCKERTGDTSRKHGKSGTKEHRIWKGIKQRCLNPNNPAYKNYGGRGIVVCARWLNSFEDFLRDMGECPEGLSLEREDNNLGYTPENCSWKDRIIQANNRRNNVRLTFQGATLTLPEWSRRTGLSQSVIEQRLNKLKWSVKKTLTTPIRRTKRTAPNC